MLDAAPGILYTYKYFGACILVGIDHRRDGVHGSAQPNLRT